MLFRSPQNLQSSPVDAENLGTVQTVAHDAAVHGGEESLQGFGFGNQLLLIEPLLCHVDGDAYGAHDAAVQIIQRVLGRSLLAKDKNSEKY